MRLAFAGGQDEQRWLVKSSTTVSGRSAADADPDNPMTANTTWLAMDAAFDRFIFLLLDGCFERTLWSLRSRERICYRLTVP
jgi:hypothetical protein